MATWVPDDRDNLDGLVADLVDMFSEAEGRLLSALAVQARAGIALGKGPEEALNLRDLRVETVKVVNSLREAYPEAIASIMDTAAEWGSSAAIKEMSAMAGVKDLTKGTRSSTAAAQVMTADLSSAMDDVTLRVLRFPNDIYRSTIGRTAVNVPLGQATGRQAQQQAWNALLDGGVTGFQDTAGREWGLSSYTEMATRTASRRAYDDAAVEQMQEHGINLVSVIVGNGACKECYRWAGKILRTDGGPTGRIDVEHATEDRTTTVRVAGTLNDAKSAGWRHPNCRCRAVAYMPGLSTAADSTTYDPKAEKERSDLRSLERQVRAAKTRAAIAADGDNTKISALQGRIREHVQTTGLPRKRNREQINLGNRRA